MCSMDPHFKRQTFYVDLGTRQKILEVCGVTSNKKTEVVAGTFDG